jgi:glycosyltransferase involved in cell wall biosynthesis
MQPAIMTKNELKTNDVFSDIIYEDNIIPIKSSNNIVVAVIPAYNEERFIGSVVLRARQYVDLVIVVDDGSSDGTANLAQLAGATVVKHAINSGKGAALNTGFRKAQELFMPSVIVMMDGDWQHKPEELSKVVEPALNGDADIVIGSRYLMNTSKVPLKRILGHWGFNWLLNNLSGAPVTDSQSGFRAFSQKAIRQIKFGSAGFSVESEMQFLARDHDLVIEEVAITIRYDDQPKRSVLSHGMKVLNGILRLVGQHRPLLFFSLTGLMVLMIGFGLGLHVLNIYYSTQEFAMGTALMSLFFGINGTLILSVGIMLHSIRALILDNTHPEVTVIND